MNKIIWIFCICLLGSFSVSAAENNNEPADPLQDLADRSNVIKPEQYIKLVKPSREYAHHTAQNLSKAEAMLLIDAKNKMNKTLAFQNDEPEPEPIDIDPTDKIELEKLMLPPIYTYDDKIITDE